MISIYQLKSKFQNLLRPIVGNLAERKITANQVTLAALALSAAGGLAMAAFHTHHWPWLLLPLLQFIRMALNAIDGMLAREHNMKSRLGAVLNELSDVIADTMLYLPFALIEGVAGWMVVIICLLAMLTEMTGLVALQIGASRRYDGPMGKSDRAFVFGTSGFLLGLGIAPGLWLNAVFVVMIALLCITVYNRANQALKETGDAQ